MPHDVVIVGGGPAGLSAALMLGRARKNALLCDSGPPRNAAAEHMHSFVTRDGIPPSEFRRIAREQLQPYASVEVRDTRIEAIERQGKLFAVRLASSTVLTRRVLLCTGMVDEVPHTPGYRDLWGKSIFMCPYCHGYEVRDHAFGYVATSAQWLDFALFLKGWSKDVIAFTDGSFPVPAEAREKFERAGVRIEERRVIGLRSDGRGLAAVQFEGGDEVAREILFVRPPQHQTALVASLGLALDEQGFVRIDAQHHTSVSGIHAAGDLTTPMQGALFAANAGSIAAAMLNHELTMELVTEGVL
ncbi:NAD(P)/FAD-dependent oxidoreductase [Hyalangium versicolor]|uniref:NAD(P)/FAD-dependent oxidoreductase n=1 Tax=Hyalangium versicolor TaxID=2861190 RepID=UPI001CCA51EE|nr:NAD(P)/FAD-dependent oxidoreductase [Hyalangium versicolor]